MARPAHTYRAARRKFARENLLIWRELPRDFTGKWDIRVLSPQVTRGKKAA